MTKKVLFVLLSVLVLSCEKEKDDDNKTQTIIDSISLGTDYINDIFYSLENGEVKSVANTSWDIAFSTVLMNATVLINEGAGIKLYFHPETDTTMWNEIDTTGIYGWQELYNSDSTWLTGAFNYGTNLYNEWGWGYYGGPSTNHNVIGTRMFIIKLADGSTRKIFIYLKDGSTNRYHFKFADFDNNINTYDSVQVSNYITKNFIYYSLADNKVVDREPDANSWDLLFTRYYDEQSIHIVTGILSNNNLKVAEVRGISPELTDTTLSGFSDNISVIGSDWKTYDWMTDSFSLVNDLTYFVKTTSGKVFKLIFISNEGRSSGKIKFEKTLIE